MLVVSLLLLSTARKSPPTKNCSIAVARQLSEGLCRIQANVTDREGRQVTLYDGQQWLTAMSTRSDIYGQGEATVRISGDTVILISWRSLPTQSLAPLQSQDWTTPDGVYGIRQGVVVKLR